jgi:hypothetical protein
MDDPVAMSLIDVYTITMNLADLPAMPVPAGTSAEGLPLGLQVVGKPFEKGTVIKGGSVDVRERREIRAVGGGIGIEQLSGPEAELAVEEGAADLEQEIGTATRPSHLLRLVHDGEGIG